MTELCLESDLIFLRAVVRKAVREINVDDLSARRAKASAEPQI